MGSKDCFVPSCPNNSCDNPDMLFVPILERLRKEWCRQVDAEYFKDYLQFCCEDHLNREDIKNYYKCKLMNEQPKMASTAQLRCIPVSSYKAKKRKKSVLCELLLQHEEGPSTKSKLDENALPSTAASTSPFKGDDVIVKTEDTDGEAVVKQELDIGLVIKIERDAVDSFNTEKPEVQLERLSQDLSDDIIVKTEDKDGEAVVKQELDIGLVIKIERDAVDSFDTEKPEAQLERLSENLSDDIIVKTEDKDGEAVVKQELDTELVIKIERDVDSFNTEKPEAQLERLSENLAFPDPRPGTSSGGSTAPASAYTDLSQTNVRTEKEKHNERDSGVPSSASFMLNTKRANNVWKKLREPSHNRFEGENSSTSNKVIKASSSIGNEQYGCHHCKYVTKKKRYLVNHVRIHMYEKLHKCERCDYSTPRLCYLKSHMCTHTGEKPYKCKQCGFSTTSQSVLKKHMNVHTDVKPHKCERCDYSTARQSDLTIHKRIHTGEKPYRCEQCGYSTPWPGRLNKHMLIHTGEKPYNCKQCGYSTSQVGNLKSHVRIHTGEKPFKCKQCEYSASHLSSLKSHIRTHTGERRYKCDQCDYRASRLGRVKMHMRTHMD